MIRMDLKELTIHREKKNFLNLLSNGSYEKIEAPYVKIEGSVSSIDIQKLDDMFLRGPVYLMRAEEANHYIALKHEKEVKEAETKEEENNEEHN